MPKKKVFPKNCFSCIYAKWIDKIAMFSSTTVNCYKMTHIKYSTDSCRNLKIILCPICKTPLSYDGDLNEFQLKLRCEECKEDLEYSYNRISNRLSFLVK